ncbi:hypothetical protein D6U78_10225 [Vibrio cholerae]|uniref:Uncharacterized protein n=1 Tax=Vibrio cholerae TaxID=666 RepID=A0ABD7SRY0_VIBCL|nr:hypothetical protein [Vibrio cholerae]MVC37402.1 hypothetical protein [Vibrio cholerae]MVF55266.1 hypothetical protein [Vibrio cholerae]TXX67281.1 hypothetical protein FXF03_01530 [Vibrio cholerae]HAS7807775.1 hypothetical protein [Vibrio cholerae]
MIAANYTMHLYCDCSRCSSNGVHREFGEFVGETWGEVAKQARAQGWTISRDKTRCISPKCKNKKIDSISGN